MVCIEDAEDPHPTALGRARDVVRARPFSLALGVSTVVVSVFLALPLVALILRSGPGVLVQALSEGAARDAIVVSLVTGALAHLAVVILGTPAAYALATRSFRGRELLIAFTELPLVLPPAVAGIALLAAFGSSGLLGDPLETIGISLPFTRTAAVIAIAFVSGPLYVRQAIAAFQQIDPRLLDASRTLGATPSKTFSRVALPLASKGLVAGSALAFARGLGEFGATIMFAGSIRGTTRTLPLTIYEELEKDFDVAIALGVFMVLLSVLLLVAIRSVPAWLDSLSTSRSRSATSP